MTRARGGWLLAAVLLLVLACAASPAGAQQAAEVAGKIGEAAPRVFYTGPGRFEVIVAEAVDAQPALELGRSVWGALSGPLGLPAGGFSSPVSVRLVPEELWNEPAVFTVTVEPAGLVGARVRWGKDTDPTAVRRAFVQALIMRQAVAWHAVGPRLTVPLWLEQACTLWSLIRERPARQDSYQQESATMGAVPPLRSLLQWERGEVESRGWELASLWLFLQLQAEPGPASAWGGWIRGVTGGTKPYETLPRAFPGTWVDAPSLELWWQTAFHHQRRARALPVMTAEASRAWLQDRSRWLAGRDGREIVLGLEELPALARESWVSKELGERRAQALAVLGVIHPYYANATLSLGRMYEAALRGRDGEFKVAVEAFGRDAVDGRELEDTVGAILDTAPRK